MIIDENDNNEVKENESINTEGEDVTVEALKADSSVNRLADAACPASAISLTLDLICDKLNATEDWLKYKEKMKPEIIKAALMGANK